MRRSVSDYFCRNACVLAGALHPKVTSSQATSCWHRKLRWRPTSVARWPWRTDFSCQHAHELRFSNTELVFDFIAPDGRAGKSTGEGRIEVRTLVAITMVALMATSPAFTR